MRCPFCSNEDTQVKDSRPTEDNTAIRRRRLCVCGARFTTFERVQFREIMVIKKNGRKSAFDRDKLSERTGITLPDYEEYFKEARSIAELEDQRQSIAQTRDFIYQSGITSLQGEIEKENNKIKVQGQKDIAKISQGTSMYNLLSGFTF